MRSLAGSWPWTAAWLDRYGPDVPHHFAIAESGGAPVGAALLAISGDRLRGRTLHVGTAGEPTRASVFVEHNTLTVAHGYEARFGEELLAAAGRIGGWDRILLPGFRPDVAETIVAARPGRWWTDIQTCPVTDLAAVRAAGGDVVAVLSSSRRQRVRRSLRALGEHEAEWCETPAAVLAGLDELADLNRARWHGAGEHTPFADERFVGFHRDLAEQLAPDGRAWVMRLRAAGATVAALYFLRDGDRALFYQSGVRDLGDNRLRPGVAAHVHAINGCAERGLDVYDFLAPADRYKRELATDTEELVWASLERPSPLAPLRRAARALRARQRADAV